jgi:hypothetical protein
VYFLIVLLVSWLFFTTITHMEKSDNGNKHDK